MTLLTEQPLWRELAEHADQRQGRLASAHPARHHEIAGLQIDLSKTHLDDRALDLWCSLAKACGLSRAVERLFSGDIVNLSEQRPAWHTILRDPDHQPEDVKACMEKMAAIAPTMLQSGITDVLHIGIGGSYLGPALLNNAFAAILQPQIQCHFIVNQNAAAIDRLLQRLNPKTTLVVAVSKSFTTPETLASVKQVLPWLQLSSRWKDQWYAVTAAPGRAYQWGVEYDHVFPIWDWLGGRYSVWSAVSLSIVLAYGWDVFADFLAGAYAVDQHFRSQPWQENVPVLMAFIGLQYRHFFNAQSQAIIPYCSSLSRLSGYLQQLHMESLGKQVTQAGHPIDYPTGAIIWGGTGPGSQHSFHQQLLQGRDCVPIDFIGIASDTMAYKACQDQMIALTEGNRDEQPLAHRLLPGHQPCCLMTLSSLTAKELGALLALYEHKVFVQSVIWDINPFDQWGVEAGKQLARSETVRVV